MRAAAAPRRPRPPHRGASGAAAGPRQNRVRIAAGGICGSDLHYYFDGRVGDFPALEPLILGHEIAGEVVETGHAVEGVAVGDRVSVNPSTPCGECRFCMMGRGTVLCRMRFPRQRARPARIAARAASRSYP